MVNTIENTAKLAALLQGKIQVKAEDWTKRLKLKAEISALEKEVKAIEERMELPEACTIGKATYLPIVNGHGDEIGKYSCYWFNGAQMPAQWRRRVS